jgi:dimeric dUTPase (all-alpha-NTP-PPase superfamily)
MNDDDKEYYNPLLEEYADTVHFTVSLANDFGYTEHKYTDPGHIDLNDLVIGLTNLITLLPETRSHRQIELVFNYLIRYGYQLGFTEEQVIEAYYSKNEENHERQVNHY